MTNRPATASKRRRAPGSWNGAWVLAALLLACTPNEPIVPRNVVFIVVDTLRRDHLGAYGHKRETSPEIDALAAEGVRFDRAYATSGWTAPSVASMLTGLYPSTHGVIRPESVLDADIPTLAEILRQHGYATSGVVSNQVIGAVSGLARGFEHFDERQAGGHQTISTEGVTETALAMLEAMSSAKAPFFLFVHYFDPHYNYQRHEEAGFAAASAGRLRGGEKIGLLRRLGPSLTSEELGFIRDLYDGEIRHTDTGIGRLLAALEARGHDRDTLVVFAADHGEEFFERGWLGHTRTLYDELVRVPLILRMPTRPGRTVVDETVSLTALAPTILDLLGLPVPDDFASPSLAPLLRGEQGEPGDAMVVTEVDFVPVTKTRFDKTSNQESLVGPRYKLIRDLLTDRIELYDTLRDPAEQRDLAAREPAIVRDLERRLDERLAGIRAAPQRATRRTLSDDEIRQLEALGYGE